MLNIILLIGFILLSVIFCVFSSNTIFNFVLKHIVFPIKNWVYQPIKPLKSVSTQKFPKYNDVFDRNSEKLAEFHQNLENDFYNKQNTTTVLNPMMHSGNNIVCTGCYRLPVSGVVPYIQISEHKVNYK